MGEAGRQVGHAVLWSVVARGGRFLLGLVSSVIVVRSLGKYDYGVLSLVRTVLTFAVIFAGAGLGQALLKYLPHLRVARDRTGARILARRVLLAQTAVWAGLLALSFVWGNDLERFYRFEGLNAILIIAIALAIFELFFTLITNILNAHYDTKLLSAANILSHVLFIGVLIILLPAGWGVIGVLVAAAVGNVAGCAMMVRRVLSLFPAPEAGSESDGIRGERLLRFSLPFTLIGVLNVIVWRQSETLFLAHFRGAAETGFFDLAYRLPQTMLEFIPGTVWPIIMAAFSEAYAKDRSQLKLAIDRYYRMLFVLTAPICLSGIALGGRMVPILFGDEMGPAALPTQVFFAIFTISMFATPLSMSLYVMEKTHVNLLVYLFLGTLNVGLDLLLIPRYGLMGAIFPVGIAIFLSPFIYKAVLDRYSIGATIPFHFIGKAFLASSPVLLLLPFGGLIESVLELGLACVVAAALVAFGFKKLRVLGREELDMLGSVPIPAANRFLRFMSS